MSTAEIRRSLKGIQLSSLLLVQLRSLAEANGLSAVGHVGHKKSWIDPLVAHSITTPDETIIVPSRLAILFPPDSRKRKRSGAGFSQTLAERPPKRRRVFSNAQSKRRRVSGFSNSQFNPSSVSASTQETQATPPLVHATPPTPFSISTFATFILQVVLRPTRTVASANRMEFVDGDSIAGKRLAEFVVGILTSRDEASDDAKIEKLWNGVREKLAELGLNCLVQKWTLCRTLIDRFVVPGSVRFDRVKAAFSGGMGHLERIMIGLLEQHREKGAREAAIDFLKDHRVAQFRKKKKAKTGETEGDTRTEDEEEEEEQEQEVLDYEQIVGGSRPLLSSQRIVRSVYGANSGWILYTLVLKKKEPEEHVVETYAWTPFSKHLKSLGYDPATLALRWGDRVVGVDDTPETIGLTDSSKLVVSTRTLLIWMVDAEGSKEKYTVHPNRTLEPVFRSYCKKSGVEFGRCFFIFAGVRIQSTSTPRSCGMHSGDMIDAYRHQAGGKPVVLLYPPSHAESLRVSSVQVHLNSEKWKVLAYYPQTEPMVDPYTVRWRSLVVDTNGNITTHSDPSPSVHQYLFWESLVLPSTSPFDFEASRPVYAVPSGQVCPFLLRLLLNQMRMKQRDAHNLITYWLKDLMKFPFILVQLMSSEVYESLVELTIDPRPDVFIRVFLLFCGCSDLSTVVREPNVESDLSGVLSLPAVESLGDLPSKYVCYEWGGMNLHASRLIRTPRVLAESLDS